MGQLLEKKSRALGAALIVLVIAGACFLLLYKLGSEPFQDYDEATYAEVTTEALASHDFLSFTFLDRPYFNKPPLLFWLMAASDRLVPQTETAMRLPSALSGVVLIGVIMVVVYDATQSLYAAALGGGILLATSSFIEPARQARFDILVSLLVIVSVYAFMRALEDRRWFLWFGAFVGLGVLAKGPIEGFGILGALTVAAVSRRWQWLHDRYFWGGVGISLLIALPWHVYETIRFGTAFWHTYLTDQILARVSSPLFTTGPTNAQYLQYLFTFAAPWTLLFCLCFVLAPLTWRALNATQRALLGAALVGAISVLVVCLTAGTKAISYLIPLYPFMALVIALSAYGWSRLQIDGMRTLLAFAFVGCLAFGFGLSIYNGFHINSYYSYEVRLAEEEKTIGETLRADGAHQFYVYDTTTLGSVMFYSQLVLPHWFDGRLPVSAYILLPSGDLLKLEVTNPHLVVLYEGTYLALARTTGSEP